MSTWFNLASASRIQNVWNGNEWNQCGMDDSNNIQNMYKASTKLAHKLWTRPRQDRVPFVVVGQKDDASVWLRGAQPKQSLGSDQVWKLIWFQSKET